METGSDCIKSRHKRPYSGLKNRSSQGLEIFKDLAGLSPKRHPKDNNYEFRKVRLDLRSPDLNLFDETKQDRKASIDWGREQNLTVLPFNG